MKICVDENIPIMSVRALQALGHDVLDIRFTADKGLIDESLWELCQREKRMLITTDKGFAQHRDTLHHGLLIVRLRRPNRLTIHQHIMQAMTQFAPEEWAGLSVVVRDAVQSIWRTGERK